MTVLTLLEVDAPPYEPQLSADDAVSRLPKLAELVVSDLQPRTDGDRKRIGGMHDAVTDPVKVDRLRTSWPLVGEFLRAEFDFATPGQRGLGRLSTSPPRLAGAFRAQLANDSTRSALGRASEEIVVGGWAAHAALQLNLADGPFEVRDRSAREIWQKWIPGIYAATRNAGPTSTAVLDTAFAPVCDNFLAVANEHGLIRGTLRKKRQRATLEHIAFFYLCAGVSLMAINTSQGDNE